MSHASVGSLTPFMQSLLNPDRLALPPKTIKKRGRKKAISLESELKLEKEYWADTLKVQNLFTCTGMTDPNLFLCCVQGEAPSVAEVDTRIQREYKESISSRTGVEPVPSDTLSAATLYRVRKDKDYFGLGHPLLAPTTAEFTTPSRAKQTKNLRNAVAAAFSLQAFSEHV